MKHILTIVFIFVISLHVSYSQTSQSQAKTNFEIEQVIVEDGTDLSAIALINEHETTRQSLLNHRKEVFLSFGDEMTNKEKHQKYRKDYIQTEEFLTLKKNNSIALKAKTEYLSANYPEYSAVKMPSKRKFIRGDKTALRTRNK